MLFESSTSETLFANATTKVSTKRKEKRNITTRAALTLNNVDMVSIKVVLRSFTLINTV